MFKKINRLTKDKEFDQAFKNGRSNYDKVLGIKAVGNKLAASRFGILISTKVSKKAVERNRIKRQIGEIIRLRLDKIKQGHDIVVIVLPAAREKTYQELEGSIEKSFKKLKLI